MRTCLPKWKTTTSLCLAFALSFACKTKTEQRTPGLASDDSKAEPIGVAIFSKLGDLPECNVVLNERMVFVKASKQFYICDKKEWVPSGSLTRETTKSVDPLVNVSSDQWRSVWKANIRSAAFILVKYRSSTCTRYESGSGFVVAQDLIATNGHVVAAKDSDPSCGILTLEEVRIWFPVPDSSDTQHATRGPDVSVVTRIDRSQAQVFDLALVEAPTLDRSPVKLATVDPSTDRLTGAGPKSADEVLQMGFSGGSTFAHFALGKVNAIQAVSNDTSLSFLASLVTDKLVAKGTLVMAYDLVSGGGASGSPVFNAAGEVVAMNFAGNTKDADTEFGYGVLIKGLRDLLPQARVWQNLAGN